MGRESPPENVAVSLLMKTPVIINERGDISVFASVEEATCMEPVDVEHGE
jgi:hypothetical protein